MDALGMIEVNSIAVGIAVGDTMLKAAQVTLLAAQPVCAGKYFVLVQGQVSAVNASIAAGLEIAADSHVDHMVIANVHPSVFKAIACTGITEGSISVGIIETFSLASAILSGDMAAKAADVELIEIRLGRGLGGKSFVILGGDVASVKHAVETSASECSGNGMIARTVVIPAPHPDILKSLM